MVVANVLVALIAYGAHMVGHGIHAISSGKDMVLGERRIQHGLTLHKGRHLNTRKLQDRRRQIHYGYQSPINLPRPSFVGPAQHQGNVQTTVVDRTLRSGQTVAVIGGPDDNGGT